MAAGAGLCTAGVAGVVAWGVGLATGAGDACAVPAPTAGVPCEESRDTGTAAVRGAEAAGCTLEPAVQFIQQQDGLDHSHRTGVQGDGCLWQRRRRRWPADWGGSRVDRGWGRADRGWGAANWGWGRANGGWGAGDWGWGGAGWGGGALHGRHTRLTAADVRQGGTALCGDPRVGCRSVRQSQRGITDSVARMAAHVTPGVNRVQVAENT